MSATYPSPSGLSSDFFLGRMRATSAGSCDAGVSGGEFGGALRLEESGTALTSFTKRVHGTGRSNFLREVPHLICPKFYALTCYAILQSE
jgi:hypothetical protein